MLFKDKARLLSNCKKNVLAIQSSSLNILVWTVYIVPFSLLLKGRKSLSSKECRQLCIIRIVQIISCMLSSISSSRASLVILWKSKSEYPDPIKIMKTFSHYTNKFILTNTGQKGMLTSASQGGGSRSESARIRGLQMYEIRGRIKHL